MSTKIYLSSLGRVVDPADATVSVFDRGFLYGDSIYETMRTAGGKVVEIERHLSRLHGSAEGIAFEMPFSNEEIRAAVQATLDGAGNSESRIRVVITRGTGPIALDTRTSASPLMVVFVQPLEFPPPETYEAGIAAAIVDVQKNVREAIDPGLKTGNYLPSILALRKAIEAKGEDAIMCNRDGNVAEGATSNVFMVAGGELSTPSLATGVLAGITRSVVLELAGEGGLGLTTHETIIAPDQLRKANEVFLTSSIRGIMPVTRLDGGPVGDGQVGAVTRRLMAAYDAYIDAIARQGRA
jgi:branched-chain amino acid aminotransferase